MKRLFWACFFPWVLVVCAEPVKVIFDTDMGNDVDDVIALSMLHALESRGAVELLAVTLTKDHPDAARFVAAVNQFYGRPGTPVGVVRDGPTKEAGKFNLLAHARGEDGALVFPREEGRAERAPEAVRLLRETLSASQDRSVTLVQVGFFTNLARLLESGPDEFSVLNGRDLISQKVGMLVVMAGAFQTIGSDNRHREYNVVQDIPSAQKLAAEWPTAVVWSGFEIGIAAPFPHAVIERDLNYVAHHPLKEAYFLYEPPPHDRPTWDPTAVLFAALPDRGYFDLSSPGTVVVQGDGTTDFHPEANGKQRFLIMSPAQALRVKEAIAQLAATPPCPKP